jgi:hypothetical protein
MQPAGLVRNGAWAAGRAGAQDFFGADAPQVKIECSVMSGWWLFARNLSNDRFQLKLTFSRCDRTAAGSLDFPSAPPDSIAVHDLARKVEADFDSIRSSAISGLVNDCYRPACRAGRPGPERPWPAAS